MKELTIEQKARAYDEALAKARNIVNSINVGLIGKDSFEAVFPELRESNDEKIRKELLKHLKEGADGYEPAGSSEDYKRWLDWLEKQYKEEYALKSFKDEDVRKFMQYIEKQAKAYEFNLPNRSYDIYAFAKDILYWLEKQGEQKPAEEINGEDYGIDSLWHAQRILEKTLGEVDGYQSDDGILEHKAAITVVKKLYEQKLATWNEEDEVVINKAESWLDTLCDYLKDSSPECISDVKDIIERLKSLRPQPKQEWSEEDEARIKNILSVLDVQVCWDGATGKKGNPYQKEIDWLKSLRQKQWKPSDEHYELEEFAKIVRGNLTGISKAVQELFEAKYLQLTGNKMYRGFKD